MRRKEKKFKGDEIKKTKEKTRQKMRRRERKLRENR